MLVAICVPVGGDDWDVSNWHKIGLDSTLLGMIRAWTYFTGRILNNFGDAVFSHYKLLWNFFSAFIHTITLYFVAKSLHFHRNKWAIIFSFIMTIYVSIQLRAEVQFHVTGNVSYTICTCMIFIFIYLINKSGHGKKTTIFDNIYLDIISWMFLGLCTSLWIENLTLCFFSILLLFDIFHIIKHKKLNHILLGGTIGAILGSCIMFSCTSGIKNRIDYSMTLFETIQKNIFSLLNHLVISNLNIYALFSFAILLAILKQKLVIKNRILKILYVLINLCILIVTLLDNLTYLAIVNYYNISGNFSKIIHEKNAFSIIFSFIILLSILIAVLLCNEKHFFLILYIAAFISVAPMILAPGSRNMLFALWVVIAISGYFISLLGFEKKDEKKLFTFLIGILLILRIENYAWNLQKAVSIEKDRNNIIASYKVNCMKAQNDTDYFLILPMMSDAFIGNMNSTYYSASIINYHNLPLNTKILFDDGFLIYNTELQIDDREGKVTINQFDRFEQDFLYTFDIKCDDSSIYFFEGTNPECRFMVEGEGLYHAECGVTNLQTGEIKNFTSNSIIYSK